MDKLAIVTPSYIDSRKRRDFAVASLASLRQATGTGIPHVIVHDYPGDSRLFPRFLRESLPWSQWHYLAGSVYTGPRTTLIERPGRGSAPATLDALLAAREQGAEYAFIHLDDHVYIDRFGHLLASACDALQRTPGLNWVRFSGYPLLYQGRATQPFGGEPIRFEHIELHPDRQADYTLWSADMDEHTIDGNYWPIALWFCVYRVDFLIALLQRGVSARCLHLCDVERMYKERDGWHWLTGNWPGRFGYINMQFGGLEMHRNKNWRELIAMNNPAIL